MRRRLCFDLLYGDLVVSHRVDIGLNASQHLHQIVRKTIVIVDEKNHHSFTSLARMTAFMAALALLALS